MVFHCQAEIVPFIVCRRLVNVLFFNEISSEFYIQKWPKFKLSLIPLDVCFSIEME